MAAEPSTCSPAADARLLRRARLPRAARPHRDAAAPARAPSCARTTLMRELADRAHAAARGGQAARAREPRRGPAAARHVRLPGRGVRHRPHHRGPRRARGLRGRARRAADERRDPGAAPRRCCDEVDQLTRLDDQDGLMRFDERIHRFTWDASGNPYLVATLERYFTLSLRVWYLVLDRVPGLGHAVHDQVAADRGAARPQRHRARGRSCASTCSRSSARSWRRSAVVAPPGPRCRSRDGGRPNVNCSIEGAGPVVRRSARFRARAVPPGVVTS